MTSYRNTDAPGQMRGYFLQIERALFWLSTLSPGAVIGIETGDDIVIRGNDGNISQEQDKSSISNNLPLSDGSIELWKTLCIWLRALDSDHTNKIGSLILATNRKIPSNRFVWQISRARSNEELGKCLDKLKSISSRSAKTKAYIEEVLAYDDEKLISLLGKITVFDNAIKEIDSVNIRDNLKIAKDIPFDKILLTLKGWIFDEVIKSWDAGTPAWIEVDSLINLTTTLVTEYNRKPFIEKTVELLPISPKEFNEKSNELFVYQLELVNADEDDKIQAINDFLRATAERTRCAKEGQLTKEDFQVFEDSLHDRWKSIFKPRTRNSTSNEEDLGYSIYYDTITHREKLKGIETEQNYTTRGAYHRLSNNLKLGWHPRWEKKINKNDE